MKLMLGVSDCNPLN